MWLIKLCCVDLLLLSVSELGCDGWKEERVVVGRWFQRCRGGCEFAGWLFAKRHDIFSPHKTAFALLE
jgi:hypothetical protein